MAHKEYCRKPFKIVDSKRVLKIGIVAGSFFEFISKAQSKFNINGTIKVVLESDGTEIDEDDYFATLEENTLIMILRPDEKWCPLSDISIEEHINDEIDGTQDLYNLIQRLHNDIGQIAFLGGCDLELLSDMDPDCLVDMSIDRSFLDQIKEASGRYLNDKREAQDALNLLKLYHASTIDQNSSKKSKV